MENRKIIAVVCCILIISTLVLTFVGCDSKSSSVDCDKVIYLGENKQFKAL